MRTGWLLLDGRKISVREKNIQQKHEDVFGGLPVRYLLKQGYIRKFMENYQCVFEDKMFQVISSDILKNLDMFDDDHVFCVEDEDHKNYLRFTKREFVMNGYAIPKNSLRRCDDGK